MLKLSENPPCLSPGVETLEELSGTWFVAHTKARNEKAFAWDLLHRNVGYFLPLYEKTSFSGGRRRRVKVPLFPSYVFFCGDEETRYLALTTNRLAQTLRVPDQEQFLRELRQVEKAIQGKAKLDPYPFAVPGKRCRIKYGPFRDLEGTILRRHGNTYLVLRVTLISGAAIMKVEAEAVEVVPGNGSLG